MRHMDPTLIEKQLQMMNEQRVEDGLPEVIYVIPYRYMKRAVPTHGKMSRKEQREMAHNNMIRQSYHRFVFIKATDAEIQHIVDQPWNRDGRLHLRYYRTHAGVPICITEHEMRPLIKLFIEQRQRFSFESPETQLATCEEVIVKDGTFKNFKASVLECRYTSKGIHLTLGIPVFNGEKMLKIYNCKPTDVVVRGQLEWLFSETSLQTIETELLRILRCRIKHRNTETSNRTDVETLNNYSLLSYLKFNNIKRANHFRVLMLLTASLRRDMDMKQRLAAEVQKRIADTNNPTTDDEAFGVAVLYVATHDAAYRTSAKRYAQSHTITSAALQQLLPLIKDLRTR